MPYWIAIDPGHGGKDPGAIGPGGLREKDVALAVSLLLYKELLYFCQPVMTRGVDVDVSLSGRAKLANTAQANIFVSVHCNGFDDPAAHGTETYCLSPGGEAENLAKEVQKNLVAAVRLGDRGVKDKSLQVLRETAMPAILVEMAFISNPYEEKLLANPAWQKLAARAIAQGIANYLGVSLQPGETEKIEEVFKDWESVSPWARDSVKLAAEKGLLKGDADGYYRPKDLVTREELAVVLARLLEVINNAG